MPAILAAGFGLRVGTLLELTTALNLRPRNSLSDPACDVVLQQPSKLLAVPKLRYPNARPAPPGQPYPGLQVSVGSVENLSSV